MNVSDVMTSGPVTARPEASLGEAADLMVKHRISGLPVVDSAGRVVGMVTEGDLLRRVELGTGGRTPGWLSQFFAPGRAAEDYVRTHGRVICEIMTQSVISVAPDTSLAEVVQIMESQQVKRLPVLQDGKLVGIVSRADLLRALFRLLQERTVTTVSDAELRKRVLAQIDKLQWAPRATVDVIVTNGVVELRGAVTDDRERAGLRVIVENTPGVRALHDRLIWVEPLSGSPIDIPKE
jgi:CBS-domain-containing membrane protein